MPRLFVGFQYAHRDEIAEMLASGTLDVGFFWGPVAVPGLETRTLVSEPRVLVLNERSALTRTKKWTSCNSQTLPWLR